jgi:hypothetical protein
MPITVETFNSILNAQGWAAAEEALMAAGGTFGEPEALAFEGFVEDDLMFGQLPGQTNPNYIPQGPITAAALGVPDAQPRQFDYVNEYNPATRSFDAPPTQVERGTVVNQAPSDLSSQFIEDVNPTSTTIIPAATVAPTATVTPTPAVTQEQAWATQYGQPGSPRVTTELNKLSDSELQNLANNPEFLSLYPQAANILTTRNTTATAASALSAQQSTWSTNYGAAGSQRAMDFVLNMDAGEFSRMTKDFKDYYAAEYAARIIRDKGVGTVSASDTLIRLINDGGVVKASQLDAITDPTARTAAATRLAKNIVTKHGSNQEAINLISGLFYSYFDRPGGTGFGPWAESIGFGFDAQGNVIGSGATLLANEDDLMFGEQPGEKTIPDYVPTGANEGAGPMATDVTFTVADIAQDLASGILTTAEAIAAYRSLNTAEGNSRATALETGGVDTGVPRAQVFPSDAPDPSEITGGGPLSRADLFSVQQDADLRRRLLADAFGTNQSPLAARASSDIFNRFARIDPLLEFSNPAQTLGQRFTGFAGAPNQTGAALNTSLDKLMGTATNPSSNFLDFVPDFRTAAQLGMSPGFADINPRLARRGQTRLMDDFDIRMSQKPELFQTPDAENLAAQIAEFRSRGF